MICPPRSVLACSSAKSHSKMAASTSKPSTGCIDVSGHQCGLGLHQRFLHRPSWRGFNFDTRELTNVSDSCTCIHTHTHTHTLSFLPFSFHSCPFPFFCWLFLFFCVLMQKRLIATIFHHCLRPNGLATRQAVPPVYSVGHRLQLWLVVVLPETRDVAGVPYKFQGFSMQLHWANYAISKSSYPVLLVPCEGPIHMHGCAFQAVRRSSLRNDERLTPQGHFDPPDRDIVLVACKALVSL